jgi:signal peptidase I
VKWLFLLVPLGIVAAAWWFRSRYLLVTVRGDSMMPALRPDSRVLARLGGRYRTGSVVVFRRQAEFVDLMIKRVAARAGEPVPEDFRGAVTDGVVPPGHLLVRGDNPASTDSRTFGYVRESAVLGSIRV